MSGVVLGILGGWLVALTVQRGAPGLWSTMLVVAVPALAVLGVWWPQPGSPRRQSLAYVILHAFETTVVYLCALSIAVAPLLILYSTGEPPDDGGKYVFREYAALVCLGAAALLIGLSVRRPEGARPSGPRQLAEAVGDR